MALEPDGLTLSAEVCEQVIAYADGDARRLLRGLALGVVEVRGDGEHRLGDPRHPRGFRARPATTPP